MKLADNRVDYADLAAQIKRYAATLGFQKTGITDTQLEDHELHLLNWLRLGRHGTMQYMARHGTMRSRPADLLPGTLRVISLRMNYYPQAADAWSVLADADRAYVSRYALGRDYHKLIRQRLKRLVRFIEQSVDQQDPAFRVLVDSAPVLEKALAQKAALGWIGKHSNLLSTDAGSWFFLAEIYTNLPLPVDAPVQKNHCGSCQDCITACPTGAIVAPYQVDARRCISYLTIELREAIPVAYRKAMGNRIYGCDDCQLVCPWNRFGAMTDEADFAVRHQLDTLSLVELFAWSEQDFLQRFEGSPIRRIGHLCWLRNIAVALGNANNSTSAIAALRSRCDTDSDLLREHINWALEQHGADTCSAPA